MKPILECIPNFSEGRDMGVIKQITDVIEAVEGAKLLDVDPGASTNRTVVTFVGDPEAVIEAAFQAIKKASEVIDMRKHTGTHPRMGATDVCPLVPISGISAEEAVKYAHKLAERVGKELNIPIYLYEQAAQTPKRQNLAVIRAGEYEGFADKIYQEEWKPDYGPQEFHAKAGQTVIGVRDFLVAYNVNLNTQSVRRANSVAFDIREKGRLKTEDGTPWGKKVLDADGNPVREAGACKSVKAIGWFVEEYGVAQVSANLTNLNDSPLHVVFEETRKSANHRGLRVTGSELVGLVPKKCLVDAGYYFLQQQGVSLGVSEEDLILIAVKSMGLDELGPFDPKKKVIEYQLESEERQLTDLDQREFNNLLASDAPAPGGGSVAALVGALGASLGAMVANLSGNKRGWDHRTAEFNPYAIQGQQLKDELLFLVNEDTAAFNKVMEAFKLPKKSEADQAARKQAIEDASKYAALVPFRVMETAMKSYDLLKAMAAEGNPNSITDAGVGALCTHTAVQGAGLNVEINLGGIEDQVFCNEMASKVKNLVESSTKLSGEIMEIVRSKM
ncbi:glutamate formimidoyltransferase [Pontibacter sp. G13]|uniref:glutamate formimidoyltransferase n=1 Tax=Pontibacter sp. G13 TaxID=3074898 RepID=UPI0028890632|nr:glutamate formimidoyltransferase [Pontibacter sp. G13]WNJ21157.1 glutamate formimidoyltransferase [Pontibacter sp. G13]